MGTGHLSTQTQQLGLSYSDSATRRSPRQLSHAPLAAQLPPNFSFQHHALVTRLKHVAAAQDTQTNEQPRYKNAFKIQTKMHMCDFFLQTLRGTAAASSKVAARDLGHHCTWVYSFICTVCVPCQTTKRDTEENVLLDTYCGSGLALNLYRLAASCSCRLSCRSCSSFTCLNLKFKRQIRSRDQIKPSPSRAEARWGRRPSSYPPQPMLCSVMFALRCVARDLCDAQPTSRVHLTPHTSAQMPQEYPSITQL